jgi:hypothetical protein
LWKNDNILVSKSYLLNFNMYIEISQGASFWELESSTKRWAPKLPIALLRGLERGGAKKIAARTLRPAPPKSLKMLT